MDPSPKQPENEQEKRQGILTATQWLKDSIFAPQESTISSIGEFLLPLLLGTMESCWIAVILIGLASAGLFESPGPLLPLWAPFVLITGIILLFYYLGQRSAKKASSQVNDDAKVKAPDAPLFITIVAVLSLFFAWLHVYAQTAFIFDPKWLLALFNDVLLLNGHFYEVVSIVGLSFLLGWRGIHISNRQIEPSDVFRALCLGLGVMIAVVILRTGQERAGAVLHDGAVLLLLIPLFLFLSLAAHALARVVFIRHSHPTGLQGSVVAQERAIIMVIGSLGLVFLLIALLVSSAVNPSSLQALAPLGAIIATVYNWLVVAVADLAVLIATPFFWLLYLYTRLFPPKVPVSPQNGVLHKPPKLPAYSPGTPALLVPLVKIILPIVFLLLVFALVWWALRRRRRAGRRINRRDQDVHESLWSWSLFWMQFRATLRGLFARFFRRTSMTEDGVTIPPEEITGEPAVRSIREIYRALLKKAARRGYSRQRIETPHEFKQRLDEKVPLAEPQLEVITEAYTLTRYSGDVPDEAQLELVRSKWIELDQKWA
jgi:hypothetical protein